MNKQIGGSILERLRIGRKNATDAAGIAAATLANLDAFAEKLPDGWNAIIGENGGALSGRQSHTARNLTRESDLFLVAAGLSGASVDKFRNVNIENAAAHCTEATFMIIGSLAGYSMGSATGCTVTNADVVDNSCTGGLIGGDVESVTNCPASNVTVTVIGDNDFSQGLVQCDVAERGGLIIGGGFGGMVDNRTAQGTGKAEGNEPVGMDGISCLDNDGFHHELHVGCTHSQRSGQPCHRRSVLLRRGNHACREQLHGKRRNVAVTSGRAGRPCGGLRV